MEKGTIKVGFRTVFAFALLLALAAVFGGVFLALHRWLGLSPESWADTVFLYLVGATGFALLSFWIRPSDQGSPAVRLHVPRPAGIEAKDGVTARSQLVNLPYEISDDMMLTLNDQNLPDPLIFASVVSVERSIYPEGDEWMFATLELRDPEDFERLGKSGFWQDVRDDTVTSPSESLSGFVGKPQ
jgi:hypothetical protein